MWRRDTAPGRRTHPVGIRAPVRRLPALKPATVTYAETTQAAVIAAAVDRLEHRGTGNVIDITNKLHNPTVATNLASFTVPQSHTAVITALGIYYSDPIIPQCEAVGWRPLINGNEIANFKAGASIYFYSSFGDPATPMQITPVTVQAGQTFEIHVEPILNFKQHLTMIARIVGTLYAQTGRA